MPIRKKCVVCDEGVYKAAHTMCPNCLVAKTIIQRSARAMMELHGIRRATGICVDCGTRPAEARDHRHYGAPLKVDMVCTPCNFKRGPAIDLHDLIRMHRGIQKPGVGTDYEKVECELENEVDREPTEQENQIQIRPLVESLESLERAMIQTALNANFYNITKAAKALSIPFRSMRYRIQKLGIETKM